MRNIIEKIMKFVSALGYIVAGMFIMALMEYGMDILTVLGLIMGVGVGVLYEMERRRLEAEEVVETEEEA